MDFIQGQKSKLSDLGFGSVFSVQLESVGAVQPDVSCFGLDEGGKLSDDRYFIFFNQPSSPEGAIGSSGDLSSGKGSFQIDLAKLPLSIRRLVFTLTLDAGTLSSLSAGTLTLEAAGRVLATYRFRGADFGALQAVMVAELYFKDVWRFAAVGQGFNGGLQALLQHFGGEAAEESASPPQTSNVERLEAVTFSNQTQSVGLGGGGMLSRGVGSPVRLSSVNGRMEGNFRTWQNPTLSNLPGEGRSDGRTWQVVNRSNIGSAGTIGTGGNSVTDTGYARRADEVDYRIYGDDMQVVEIELDPGETVRAEAGAMMYMREGIEMQTSMDAGSRGGGGFLGNLMGGITRVIAGESFFITTFTHNGKTGKSHVAFAAPYPGKIIPLDLREVGGRYLCQRDAFLCSAKGVDVEVAFTKKLGAGFFGGEGFILQRLVGDGLAFIHAGGAIIEKTLSAGETVRVDTGCIVGFAESVGYDIQFVGGFKNALFGGEGLFLATLRGPGLVYMQSLPLSRLADRIRTAMPGGK